MNKSFNASADKSIGVFTNVLDMIQKSNNITKDIKIGLSITDDEFNFNGLVTVKKINDVTSFLLLI